MKKIVKILTALCLAGVFAAEPTAAREVQDIKGNRIEITDNVQRIADLWHANNQIVLLLGGAYKLVATTTVIKANSWYNEVFPNIKNVPALTNGQDVQLEELLAANPDVVLASNATMIQEVNQAGLKGVLVGFQDFDGLKKTVRITAEVIGGSALHIAQEYINELDGNINFVAARLKAIDNAQKPRVLHISNAHDLLKIDGGKSMIGDWIVNAGGRNALPEQGNLVDVSMEEIVKANPDVIIVGSANAAAGIEKIKQDPLWANINAVKHGRIYANPLGTFPWDRYSAEEALQILWAAKLFHPDLFKDVDMVQKTQAFYKKYYRYDLSTENAEQILRGLNPIK